MTARPRPRGSTADRHDRKTNRRGLAGEWRAGLYLAARGFTILGRRVRTPAGEIDLIARRGSTVVFLEVKVRRVRDEALAAVSPRQQARIAAAAAAWLSARPDLAGCDMRFDVIAMTPRGLPLHIRHAFTADAF